MANKTRSELLLLFFCLPPRPKKAKHNISIRFRNDNCNSDRKESICSSHQNHQIVELWLVRMIFFFSGYISKSQGDRNAVSNTTEVSLILSLKNEVRFICFSFCHFFVHSLLQCQQCVIRKYIEYRLYPKNINCGTLFIAANLEHYFNFKFT